MKGRIQHPMYTAAALAAANPVLLKGEVVYESDTRKRKIGDGVTPWNNLVYEITSGASGGSKPLGPFPGYQKIAGEGTFALGNLNSNLIIDFETRFTAEAIVGRHILFDAELHGGVNTLTSMPAIYAKIVDLSYTVTVVDFTTANSSVIGLFNLFANVRAVIDFQKQGNVITGCQLITYYTVQAKDNGIGTERVPPLLKWHGIYLEEVENKSITI